MASLTIFRSIAAVNVLTAQSGKTYWKVTDDTGVEWNTWEANIANAANNIPQGQLAQMGVSITPAKDPRFGMNYSLRAIAPAPAGAQPTPAGHEAQMAQQAMMQPTPTPQPQQMMPIQSQPQSFGPQTGMQPAQQPMPQQPQPITPPGGVKTLGQGGQFSDADIVRMARSTAIEAVSRLAIVIPDEFKDTHGKFDWHRFYLAAEALHKFIVYRSHEGWVPGQEIEADGTSNEQQVLAEVHAQLGDGLVDQGFADNPEPVPMSQASADNATGGDVAWDG